MQNTIRHQIKKSYPLLNAKERISVWEKAKGMWKNRKPEPIKELRKIRKELNRCK